MHKKILQQFLCFTGVLSIRIYRPCKNGQHFAVNFVCKSSGSREIRDTKKSSEDSQFYRFFPFDHWSDINSNCSSFCSFQVYMKDDLISCWLWTHVQCYYSAIYSTVVHWWFFFLVAVVVVFVVVVNNNEKISYQGHYQIHVHFQLCYIFSHCSCSLVLLVLFYAPSFS